MARKLAFISLVSVFVALLGFAALLVEARPQVATTHAAKREAMATYPELTNAQRLRRGLPLSKPRQLFSPTRVRARDASPSYIPTAQTGYIKVVRTSDNAVLGYMSSSYLNASPSPYTWYGLSQSRLLVTFTPPGSGVFDISISTPGYDYPFLGLTGSSMPSPTNPDPYQQNVGRITQTNQTPPGAPPSDVLNGRWPYSLTSESAVWNYDSGTKEITAVWVTEGASATYPVHFFSWTGVAAHVDGFAFTTNTLTYNGLLDLYLVPADKSQAVRFYFESA
ncbi:hypothetical protein M413DRAFT_128584 [Hebeloma cylindrosporum]|uniref:Glycoside hydrolase family 16 protein n=1 Tax=Hebeloma cylindrosporum TaxID=76867 RepID=A0A0C3BZZ2_HEBCY|nr:hypothetical protein M413DRAFT_128584 [Hebeloma cylindrosporum h7]